VDTVHECDRQTDRQMDKQTGRRTDRITITKTVQRIASHGKNLHFTYRVFSYTYSMTYSSGFFIIIPDKTTISVVILHQMDIRLTWFVLDTRLVLETRLILETRLLLEQVTKTPDL